MNPVRTLVAALLSAGLIASPALAERPRDQDRAFEATKQGRSMPLPERRATPTQHIQ